MTSAYRETSNRRHAERHTKGLPDTMPGPKSKVVRKRPFGLQIRWTNRDRTWSDGYTRWYATERGRDEAMKAYNRGSYGFKFLTATAVDDIPTSKQPGSSDVAVRASRPKGK